MSDVYAFENSDVWRVMRGFIEGKLIGNYNDLCMPDLGLAELKLLQGAALELRVFLELPELLREYVPKHEEDDGNA